MAHPSVECDFFFFLPFWQDYEEDFEELDEDDKDAKEEPSNLELGEEVKAIRKAMGEENERVRASFNTLSKGEEEGEEKPKSSRGNSDL